MREVRLLFACCLLPACALLVACGGSEPSPPAPSAVPREVPDTIVSPAAVGRLPGKLEVSATGAATYHVPIDVPAGRNGMQPSLSLDYDSRRGNGAVGVGWMLSGLPEITRCPPTIAFGGRPGGIFFNAFPLPAALDQFCLGDLPLVAVAGEYGVDGTEYRTEPDIQARIFSHGSLGGAPAKFEIDYKDGRIATLADRLEAGRVHSDALDGTLSVTSEQAIYGWALSLLQDRSGNSMTVSWGRVTNPGDAMAFEFYPVSIGYSYASLGDPVGTPRREVRFDYESRPDWIDTYISGFHLRTVRRLHKISTYAPGLDGVKALVHTYTLSYKVGSFTQRSLLTSLQACDADGRCLPATQFEWNQGDANFADPVDIMPMQGQIVMRIADLNGDGRDDLLYKEVPSKGFLTPGTEGWWVRLSAGGSFGPARRIEGTDWYDEVVGLVDHDLNGTAGILVQRTLDGCVLYRWNGIGFEPAQKGLYCDQSPKAGDIDGNGTPDLFVRLSDWSSPSFGGWYWQRNLRGSLESPFSAPSYTGFGEDAATYVSPTGRMVRLLGNGATQLVFDEGKAGDRFDYLYTVGGGPIEKGETNLTADWDTSVFVDINGDGLDDVLDNYDGSVRINTGWGFGPSYEAATVGWSPPDQLVPANFWTYEADNGVRVVDFNNDGRMDFAKLDQGEGEIRLSTGRMLVPLPLAALDYDEGGDPGTSDANYRFPVEFLDHNGDGVMDVIAGKGGTLRLFERTGKLSDHLRRVTVGTGAWEAVEYGTLADPLTYAPGPGYHESGASCKYPQRCDPRATVVARSITRDAGVGVAFDVEAYAYADARSDVRGEGFVGFARIRRNDPVHQRVDERAYDVLPSLDGRYAYLGLPTRTTTFHQIDADRFRVETTSITNMSWESGGGASYFARPTAETASEYEWTDTSGTTALPLASPLESVVAGRTPFRTVHETRSFDNYANLLAHVVAVDGGTTTTTTTEYEYRPGDWLIGLVHRIAKTSTGENGATDGNETTFTYDSLGRRTGETVEPSRPELTRSTQWVYASDGLVDRIEQSGPSDPVRTTRFTYDAERVHLASRTDPAGHETQLAIHPALGVLVAATDPNGATTTFSYDTFGRMRGRTDPGGHVTNITEYATSTGYLVEGIENTGGLWYSSLDRLERPIVRGRLIDGAWSVSNTTYDEAGRVWKTTLPAFTGDPSHEITRSYDGMGRLVSASYADGTSTSRTYTPLTVTTRDRSGHERRYEQNADGKLAHSVDRLGGRDVVTTYTYGPFGRIDHVTDSTGNVVDQLTYDSLGRVTGLTDADAGATTSTFDAFGELVGQTNALGQSMTFVRDALGRISRITDADGTTTYSWDTATAGGVPVLGALGSATSPDGAVTTFTYDGLGREVARTVELDGKTYTLGRTYDAYGRLRTVSYPSTPGGGLTVTYTYDGYGMLDQISRGGSLLWDAQDRDAFGHQALERLGNGVYVARSYDPRNGRLSEIESYRMIPYKLTTLVKDPLQALRYTYYGDGTMASRVDEIEGIDEKFGYDEDDRLTGWTHTDAAGASAYTLTYDDLGNLTSSVGPDGTHAYGHGLTAGPHAVTSFDGHPLDYDLAGRRIAGPDMEIAYTAANLPREITTPAGDTVFTYDAFGVRVKKQGPSGTTVYVGGLYEYRAGAEKSHHFYVAGPGRMVAEIVEKDGAQQTRYLHPDHLGSTQVITDAGGSVIERRWYTPFGQLTTPAPTASDAHTIGFTGHEADFAEGLINMNGRIYDPRTRRFLTPDPLVSRPALGQSFNRYAYVLNSPLRLVDPTGFEEDGPDEGEDEGDCYGECDFDDDYVYGQADEDDDEAAFDETIDELASGQSFDEMIDELAGEDESAGAGDSAGPAFDEDIEDDGPEFAPDEDEGGDDRSGYETSDDFGYNDASNNSGDGQQTTPAMPSPGNERAPGERAGVGASRIVNLGLEEQEHVLGEPGRLETVAIVEVMWSGFLLTLGPLDAIQVLGEPRLAAEVHAPLDGVPTIEGSTGFTALRVGLEQPSATAFTLEGIATVRTGWQGTLSLVGSVEAKVGDIVGRIGAELGWDTAGFGYLNLILGGQVSFGE